MADLLKELFLCAALALPALPQNQDRIYAEFYRAMKREMPEWDIVIVHKDEKLLDFSATRTPLLWRRSLKVWIKRSA